MRHLLLTSLVLAKCIFGFSQVQFSVDQIPSMKNEIPTGSTLTSSQCVKVGNLFNENYYVLTLMDLNQKQNAGMATYFVAYDATLGIEEINGLISFFKYYRDTLLLQNPQNNVTVDYKIATTLKNRPLYFKCCWEKKGAKWKCYINDDFIYPTDYETWLSQIENARNIMIQNTKLTDFSKTILDMFSDIKFVNSLINDPSKIEKTH